MQVTIQRLGPGDHPVAPINELRVNVRAPSAETDAMDDLHQALRDWLADYLDLPVDWPLTQITHFSKPHEDH